MRQRYDDAIHELAQCRTVPKRLAGELARVQELLATAPSDDAAALATKAGEPRLPGSGHGGALIDASCTVDGRDYA